MIPKTAIIWIPLDTDKAARVEITIVERGLGAMDAPTERQPTLKETEDTTNLMKNRRWTFDKPL